MKLKVCFVGIGSIAKRHIKNLKKVCLENKIELIIDAVSRHGKKKKEDIYNEIRFVYSEIKYIKEIYDVIFITNPTEYHIETLNKIDKYGRNFFIEKPISSFAQVECAKNYKEKKDAVYYIACPLRYNAVIQYIKKNIDMSDVISVRSISSSYLPDWRPGQDYRDTYSAHKSMGGGVAIDLIHEWDYLTYILGRPEKINCMTGKKSNLEIDSDDYAIYIAEYKDKIVELHLDYFGRKTMREIVLFTNEDTIVGNIVDNKIIYFKSGKIIEFTEKRDDFQIREIKHFLDMIEGKVENDSTIKHAIQVLEIAQGEL